MGKIIEEIGQNNHTTRLLKNNQKTYELTIFLSLYPIYTYLCGSTEMISLNLRLCAINLEGVQLRFNHKSQLYQFIYLFYNLSPIRN